MLGIVEATNREAVEVHVVPDLLQFIALRARLENLDGVPIISLNDVPLRGFNSVLKRGIDVVISATALLGLSIPFAIISALIKYTSKGHVFYKQERMGLDGKAFRSLQITQCTWPRTKPVPSGRATTTHAARR
jgi:lipopolysaccharide/colanic/teichoic acid biosynthesis glycosyltransferase